MTNPLDELMSDIYQTLFNKTRQEMIDESKHKINPISRILHNNDIDEMMRDCMTIEAIEALNHAEMSISTAILNMVKIRDEFELDIEAYCIAYRLKENQKLWEWE